MHIFTWSGPGWGRKLLPIGGLLLMCLIWAAGWIRADFGPRTSGRLSLTPMMEQALLLGLFAFAARLAALVRRARWRARDLGWEVVLVGVGLFVVPAVLTSFAKERIGDETRVVLFSLTPLFAVIFEPYLGIGAGEAVENRGGILAAMIAIAGTFLVFPVELPRSYGAALVMLGVLVAAASIAAANCAAVRLVRRSESVAMFATIAAGSAGLVISFLALAFGRDQARSVPFDAWSIVDLFALTLLFWLMRRMSAAQMTTRFLIAPLIANVISLGLLRPHVQIQSWAGLVMIAAGSGWLLLASEESSATFPTFFKLD
jgi:drug/metabolite transporter (DMT)-like permease